MLKSNRDQPAAAGLGALADHYDAVLCDIWGVVHDGVTAFSAAADALARFRAKGGTVLLVTNAPRPAGAVIEQLDSLGVGRGSYDSVVTSGDVTGGLIAERAGRPVYHLGPGRDAGLFDPFDARTAPRVPLEAAEYVVCTGLFEDETETPDDYESLLATMHRRRLPMVCANPDIVVHRGGRVVYCAGALGARYTAIGGDTVYAGKPHAPIYETSFRQIADIRGAAVAPGRVLAIGDAIHTDMAGAGAMGIDAAFIAGGIHAHGILTESRALDANAYAGLIATLPRKPLTAMIDLAW